MATKTVTIIGLGNVGTAFLKLLPEIGYSVISAYNRSSISDSIKNSHPQTTFRVGMPQPNDDTGRLIFITVSDDAIESVTAQLASTFPEMQDKFIIHCSGALSSQILQPLAEKGAKTASFHPLQSITKNHKSFKGCWFDMEGEEEVLKVLDELTKQFQAKNFRIQPEAKTALHASAVVASNYLVVLADLLQKISAHGGIPEETAIKALLPLMHNTLANIEEAGPTDALTGPVARGDVDTIRRHLQELKNAPDLLSLYKRLGKSAVELAKKKSGNSDELNSINNLFS